MADVLFHPEAQAEYDAAVAWYQARNPRASARFEAGIEDQKRGRESGVAKKRQFVVVTPLGHRVILTRDRWREIVRFKHPALTGHEAEVRACLRDPEVVRTSVKDADVHLYYRTNAGRYLCVVVGGEDLQARFVITAYFTDGLKKGRELWTR